ncbi:MAG: cytochrome c biogenesis protein CcsA [Bacteriovoracaceae bacterium]|nr:cytochrome c biogenesis protein CcsA [Bacteriovoracaceae bacterium]
MKLSLLIITFLIFGITDLYSAETYFCNNSFEKLPIQQNGRVKPLYVHANEVMKELTGKSDFGEHSAVMNYCLLSLNGLGIDTKIELKIKIEHVELKKLFNLLSSEESLSYTYLIGQYDSLKLEMRSNRENDSYVKAISKLLRKIDLYQEVTRGINWTFAEKFQDTISWVPLVSFITEEKFLAQKNKTPIDPFTPLLFKSKENYEKTEGQRYLVEYYYAKIGLVNIALFLTISSLVTFISVKNPILGVSLTYLTMIIQIILISLRVYISGRAPITNMYETVLSSGFGGLVVASLMAFIYKGKIYYYIGLVYNFCSLLMLIFANGMLSASISPLVPVLRDNFWLSTHVTTVILSYGALALSWVLSNYVVIRRRFFKIDSTEELHFSTIVYSILKVGTTMLIAGIILGGVWADYSWGRYWGWDPKETWSLIVFCIYIIILHGRYTNWITVQTFFRWTALAFMSVMMAWFGVNYILATGLHSYGFSEGGALFLGSFFVLQICLVVITDVKFKHV